MRDKPDEIIEYPYGSKNYYTCEPFEKTKGRVNKYPGLIRKEEDGKIAYKPCCFPVSHHKKPNSPLNKYIAEQSGMAGPSEKKISENILNREKRLPEFRRGYLPDRLAEILKFAGLEGKEYLRYGVQASSQSIIDAMAMIESETYEDWINNPVDARKKVIKKLRGSSMLNAASQSLSWDYINDALKNGAPLFAADFHPIVEYYFKSTVVVINGNDLARPNSRFGFIAHLRKRKNLIILYTHPGINQVEVIGSYDYNFKDYPQPVINKFLDIKRLCFAFFSPDKYIFPRIAKISNRATHQYIDNFGKNRGFLVDDQTIFMPPSAPVSKPVVGSEQVYYGDIEAVLKEFDLEPRWFMDGIVYTNDFALPIDIDTAPQYLMELPVLPEDYIPPFIIATTDFIKVSKKSENKAKNPFIKKIELDPNDILTIYPQDVDGYLELVKRLPEFKWEELTSLKYVLGKIHWIVLGDQVLQVTDVEYKSADDEEDIGTWSVAIGKKSSDTGHWIEYPDDKWGKVVSLVVL